MEKLQTFSIIFALFLGNQLDGQIIPFYQIEEIDRPFNTDALSLDEYGYSMAQIYYLNRILEAANDRQAKRLFASVYRTEIGMIIAYHMHHTV